MQWYHYVTLAYDDNRTGQPGRAVPFSPAFAVCDEFMLSCVSRFNIQSLILQCCDVLHAHWTNHGCLWEGRPRSRHGAVSLSPSGAHMVCLLQLIPANASVGLCCLHLGILTIWKERNAAPVVDSHGHDERHGGKHTETCGLLFDWECFHSAFAWCPLPNECNAAILQGMDDWLLTHNSSWSPLW